MFYIYLLHTNVNIYLTQWSGEVPLDNTMVALVKES